MSSGPLGAPSRHMADPKLDPQYSREVSEAWGGWELDSCRRQLRGVEGGHALPAPIWPSHMTGAPGG